MNIPAPGGDTTEEYDNLNSRKHTFGKENTHSDTNNHATSHYSEAENRPYQVDDEVKIMETGYSSTRKPESDREFLYNSNTTTRLLHEELLVSIEI